MDIQNKKIGIWGFGTVGKSVARFLHSQQCHLSVLNATLLSAQDFTWCKANNIIVYQETTKESEKKEPNQLCAQKESYNTPSPDSTHEQPSPTKWKTNSTLISHHVEDHVTPITVQQFLNTHDIIIPSPGIDIRPWYQQYKNKWLSELDLLVQYWHKPIIAITGTAGKTTVTSMLSQLLAQYDIPVATGGNIGTPMLDLVAQQKQVDYALLELSSFQLEHAHNVAPHLAIWTNLFANHLDRHATMADYAAAKYTMLKSSRTALVPLNLVGMLRTRFNHRSPLTIFSTDTPTQQELREIKKDETLFFASDTVQSGSYVMRHNNITTPLVSTNTLPQTTFNQNWLIVVAALQHLGCNLSKLPAYAKQLHLPAHRLEYVGTIRGAAVYNDSKATTPAATHAALQQLQHKPIHLLLGGLSKGIDRQPFIAQLPPSVAHVYCFGAESAQLLAWCRQKKIRASAYPTLDDAVATCMQKITAGEQLLFSPAGSSFDLFDNFAHRGDYFKTCIKKYE